MAAFSSIRCPIEREAIPAKDADGLSVSTLLTRPLRGCHAGMRHSRKRVVLDCR